MLRTRPGSVPEIQNDTAINATVFQIIKDTVDVFQLVRLHNRVHLPVREKGQRLDHIKPRAHN